jgi:hypothetical protein
MHISLGLWCISRQTSPGDQPARLGLYSGSSTRLFPCEKMTGINRLLGSDHALVAGATRPTRPAHRASLHAMDRRR